MSATGSAPPDFPAVVDIELTSRCNAHCSFCPRDQTPHHGLIDEATFVAALGRAVEYRDALAELPKVSDRFETARDTIWLSFCGMGEPLLHPRVVEYVGRVREAGLRPIINTNGALLSPTMADNLVDAGLALVFINVGEVDDTYEEVYGLPFERTRTNVEHFLADGRCKAAIVLVDHRDDPDHVTSMHDFWSQRGAESILPFSLINRAGSLAIDEPGDDELSFLDKAGHLLAEKGDAARCSVPFLYPFIGYDGNYYLCSSDWRKEVNLGTVFERALVDLFDDKAEHLCSSASICQNCTHEPSTVLAHALARAADGREEPEETAGPTADDLLTRMDHFSGCVSTMRTNLSPSTDQRSKGRRLIPVRS
jgi:MoaA/NifB/PqqE/SkfB family radical SAM enzyme